MYVLSIIIFKIECYARVRVRGPMNETAEASRQMFNFSRINTYLCTTYIIRWYSIVIFE